MGWTGCRGRYAQTLCWGTTHQVFLTAKLSNKQKSKEPNLRIHLRDNSHSLSLINSEPEPISMSEGCLDSTEEFHGSSDAWNQVPGCFQVHFHSVRIRDLRQQWWCGCDQAVTYKTDIHLQNNQLFRRNQNKSTIVQFPLFPMTLFKQQKCYTKVCLVLCVKEKNIRWFSLRLLNRAETSANTHTLTLLV